MTAVLRAAALRGYAGLVESLGGKPHTLLRRFHIDPTLLEDEDALIPMRNFAHLMEASAQRLKCPDFGLRLASVQDVGILGPLAVAMQNARTVAEAMGYASRHLFMHSTSISFSMHERSPFDPSLAEMRFEIVHERLPLIRQVLDVGLGVTHRILTLLGGARYQPEVVLLGHKPLAPISAYARFFGAPARVEQPFSSLLLRPKILGLSLNSINESIRQMAVDYLMVQFPAPDQTLSARVAITLRKVMGTPLSRRPDIAEILGLSERTLQRRLSEENTTFDAVKDGVLKEAAGRYLRSTDLPLIRVSDLLGLAEPAVLTRMCKRWFNAVPSDVRRLARSKNDWPSRLR